ncbi:PREDICTED: uncharacterized protein LOC104808089 [Tarenaya hassleriana]|uniref:uncharacterized protein LOC104808089 n=1 Tax=Tarenaya hassleriana TaxID=28532 RepID=UPI00053C4377|nr:PREDICTED: uncharacterized protein LOC104808089 [Tarenaya hassleriana]
MSETETLAILDEIESLVSDHLQVVSYKWLSRNFLVSSNSAKRLLKEFAEKRGNGLEVIYTLSGWLKNSPSDYHIRLVSSSKLSEAEKDFNGKYSVQVYSVQASVPTDPAALWNAEFVQTEELFKQPSEVDNCLRNNRFCGVSNSFVKRNVEGTVVNACAPQTKTVAAPLKQEKKFQQPSPKVGVQLPPVQDQSLKSSSDKEKVPSVPLNKEGHDQKSSSGTGSSLTNLWGRASSKSKNDSTMADDKNGISDRSVGAEAQIATHDAIDDDVNDDKTQDVKFRRASKQDHRKRKVIFDLSDEEYEDAVSLASPGVPKAKSYADGKQSPRDSSAVEMEIDEPKVKEEDMRKAASVESSGVSKNGNSNTSSSEKIQAIGSEGKANSKDKTTETSNSLKRRKVLKTRIDERGREVTEVVWEDDETEVKKGKTDAEKKEESNTTKKISGGEGTDASNRAVAGKKTPTTTGNAGAKQGSKKGGSAKDPKQGNILSFFKRV